jgi:hypothetical protein
MSTAVHQILNGNFLKSCYEDGKPAMLPQTVRGLKANGQAVLNCLTGFGWDSFPSAQTHASNSNAIGEFAE